MAARYTVYVFGKQIARFDDCAAAIAACEGVVDQFLVRHAADAGSAEELSSLYEADGEVPQIAPPDCGFSPGQYAIQRCRELAAEGWNEKDAACKHAQRYTLEAGSDLDAAAVGDRLRLLHEPRTFGGPSDAGGMQYILRLRDGTAIRLSRDTERGPIAITVVLPRQHAYLGDPHRRGFSDYNDAERRHEAIEGLLRDPLDLVQWLREKQQDGSSDNLGLDGCGLTSLPAELWQCGEVEVLSLTGNWLTELPPEIGRLDKLQELWLSGNRLTTLPPEIGLLRNLKQLVVSANYLSTLPPGIGELSQLETLDLSANLLTELPPEIGNLPKLRHLRLSKNRLRRLPGEIGRLSNLKRLDLDRNRLRELPAEIGNLADLSILWLNHNQLTGLPPELGKLTKLKTYKETRKIIGPPTGPPALKVEENPLVDPPAGIRGEAEIIAYLRTRLEAKSTAIVPRAMALAANGSILALLYPNRLLVRDTDSAAERTVAADLAGDERELQVSLDGRRVSLRRRRYLRIWDTATGALLRTWDSYGKDGFDDARMVPDGRTILARRGPGVGMDLVHIESGEIQLRLAAPWPPWLIQVSPDGRWVTASSEWNNDAWREVEDATDLAWNTATGDAVPFPGGWIRGRWALMITAAGATVRDLTTCDCVFHRPDCKRPLTAAAALPDNRAIAVGFGDGRLGLWDLTGDSEVRRLAEDTAAIAAIAASPNGRTVAAASADGAVLICAVSGSAVERYQAGAPMTDCVFRPNGSLIALDQTGRIHLIATQLQL